MRTWTARDKECPPGELEPGENVDVTVAAAHETAPAPARTDWPRVRAIILNYNGYPHVLDAVEALTKTEWPEDRLDIVVVDNGSTDDSVEDIIEAFPRVEIRSNPANNGFPANNLALADRIGLDYLALINNDAFVEPGWLEPLVAALEADPSVGTASAKILFAQRFAEVIVRSDTFVPELDTRTLGVQVSGIRLDGEDVWDQAQLGAGFSYLEHGPAGFYAWSDGAGHVRVPFPPDRCEGTGTVSLRLSSNTERSAVLELGDRTVPCEVGEDPEWFDIEIGGGLVDVVNNAGSVLIEGGFCADRGFKKIDDGRFDEPCDVFAWCGNGVLFRPSYLHDVGLFDDDFFAYYEDVDMAWRGRARGWRHRYAPAARIRHLHATTSGEGSPLFQHYVERNRLLMLVKNAPIGYAMAAVVRYLISTGGYARADVIGPLRRRQRPRLRPTYQRVRSFGGFLKQLPTSLRQRRENRRRQSVPDRDILAWAIPMKDHR